MSGDDGRRSSSRGAIERACPVVLPAMGTRVTLAHGEGGRLMRQLIRDRIIARLPGPTLPAMDDAGRLPQLDGELAVTTDSFVVSPLFFPGGDIGSLAVYGTINDLAVSGAVPMYLTLSLILEEGLPLKTLDRVLDSVAAAARTTAVQMVAGDTKVVPRGAADGMFITTTGIGRLLQPVITGPGTLAVDDVLLVSGPIGRHGIAVLCAREDLGIDPSPTSDSAPLAGLTERLQEHFPGRIKAMRDATRGGVAAVLHEWAESSGLTLTIAEEAVPVTADVRGVCELLGLDPLHVVNEGTMVVAVEPSVAASALEFLRGEAESRDAAQIGRVAPRTIAGVTVRRPLGGEQPLDDPIGAPLPRIC